MAKAFEDTSIFQNIVEYEDEQGRKYRAQYSTGTWNISEIRGGVSVFIVTVGADKKASPERLHALMNAA